MSQNQSIAVLSEILAIDQRMRARLAKALPKGMELSHFSVLNHLATMQGGRTPAQLAQALNVSRGAMTNTITKLEARGDVHVQADWEDARKKNITISEAGRLNREMALKAAAPILEGIADFSEDEERMLLSLLRRLRMGLSD